jgi:hypothetical protein
MITTDTFPPINFLRDLREEVLKHSLKRMPKWKFRLSADIVMQLQPKPTYLPSTAAIELGFARPEFIRFEGMAVKVDGGADGAMLIRLPRGYHHNYWQRKFEVVAYNDTEWLLNFRGGCWKYGAPQEGNESLKAAVVSALRDGFFNQLTPAAMLSPHCLICGKGLTDPASMARWIGPECAGTSSLRIPLRNTETLLATS